MILDILSVVFAIGVTFTIIYGVLPRGGKC